VDGGENMNSLESCCNTHPHYQRCVFLEREKHTPYSCSQQWLNRFEWVTNIVEEGTEKREG